MTGTPNPDDFYRVDHLDEYEVQIEIRATVTETVKAESEEAARSAIEAMLAKNEIEVFGEDIRDVRIGYCRHPQTMFLIRRPGTNVTGTTRLQPGDLPRDPAAYEAKATRPTQ